MYLPAPSVLLLQVTARYKVVKVVGGIGFQEKDGGISALGVDYIEDHDASFHVHRK